jgi:hypothetical protein
LCEKVEMARGCVRRSTLTESGALRITGIPSFVPESTGGVTLKMSEIGYEVVYEPAVVGNKELRFRGSSISHDPHTVSEWVERHNFGVRNEPSKYICLLVTITNPVYT